MKEIKLGENNFTLTKKENARYLEIMRKETPPLKRNKTPRRDDENN